MAAFAQATPTPAAVPTRTRAPSHTKLLPDGPCNHRNTDLGPNAPVCGCQRFWCNDNTTVGGRPVDIPWCVCGHHACFHAAGDPSSASTSVHLAPSQTTSFAARLVMDDTGAQNQGRHGPVDGSQPDPIWNVSKAGWWNPATPTRRTSSGSDRVRDAPQPPVWATGRQVGSFGANPSPLPSIPSICRLGSSHLRLFNDPNNSMSTEVVPSPVLPGMDTSMHSTTEDLNPVLGTPTFAGAGSHRTLEPHKWREASLDPTIQDSTDGESTRPRPSPSRTFMAQVLARRTAQNSGAPRPVPQALDEVARNATEFATSLENTQDLRSFDHNVQETRDLMSNLCESLADVENNGDRADVKREEPRNHGPERERAHASQDGRAESLATSLRNIPLILQRLAPHLNHLHQHLTAYPNVSTDIRDIQSRVLSLETASFQHIPPEEILDKFENFDVRLLELEQRVKDFFAENDFDGSSKDTLVGSDASGHDPENAFRRLEALEYRIESLEATLPSPSNPWEIEVVLLPWGKDLKGLWFSASEWESGITTGSQSSEDRAQSVSSLSSIKAQPQLMSAQHLEQEAIDRNSNASHESASLEGWYPRACGRSGVAYKRLESRGFVRRVQIKDSSAGHIQTRICEEFDFLIDLVSTSCRPLEEEESQMSKEEEEKIDLHGLRASILPLRKKRKDSQLMFLGASELVTASLWTAQFLASGVMMRARGGVKRLYMTHGAAYKQLEMGEEDGWTWANIKRLPRFYPSSNVYDEADSHDEPCWDHNPNFDPPRDTTTSIISKLSLRTGRNPSQESSSPGFDSQGNESSNNSKAPMTPQSELPSHAPSLRPARRIERTLSAPMPHFDRQHSQPSASKRRMTVSFNRDDEEEEEEEEEEEASRRASLETAAARKRRRFQHSSSNASADAHRASVAATGAGNATCGAFGYTPRRSREPSSPLRSQAISAGPSTTYAFGGRGTSVASAGGVSAGSVIAAAACSESCKGANTPGNAAYMTPFSGMAEGGAYSDDLLEGGDTEVDSSGDEDDEMTDAAADKANNEMAADADAETKDNRPLTAATSQDGGGGDTDFEGCSGVEGDDDDDDSAFDSDEEMDLVQHFDSDGMEYRRREDEDCMGRSRALEHRGRDQPPIVDYTDEEAVIEHPEDDDDDDYDDDDSSSSSSSSSLSSSLVDRVGSVAAEPRARSGEEVEREQGSHSESSDDEIDLDDDRKRDL